MAAGAGLITSTTAEITIYNNATHGSWNRKASSVYAIPSSVSVNTEIYNVASSGTRPPYQGAVSGSGLSDLTSATITFTGLKPDTQYNVYLYYINQQEAETPGYGMNQYVDCNATFRTLQDGSTKTITYCSVEDKTKPVNKFLAPVNGAAKKCGKLYGSVNGAAKLIGRFNLG